MPAAEEEVEHAEGDADDPAQNQEHKRWEVVTEH
jgi:hypothetical protein